MYQKKLTRNKKFGDKTLKINVFRLALANKESVFVTTNHKKMLEEASKIFKDNGYEIQTLDFSKPKKASFISFPNIH